MSMTTTDPTLETPYANEASETAYLDERPDPAVQPDAQQTTITPDDTGDVAVDRADDEQQAWAAAQPSTDTPPEDLADRQPLSPLAHLPLALTLRCGSLSLSLEQLQRLDHGAVLEVQGVTPGQAWLCSGEQVVAEGELVDVGGRLGLQITRMTSLT
nr:FliM/FliN family flagellar motor switch protein [Pseudomonas sp. PA27(2017)]